MSAVPIEATAWRTAVENDDASVILLGASSSMLHEVSGLTRPDTPHARIPCNSKMSQNGVEASMNAIATEPSARQAPKNTMTGRA